MTDKEYIENIDKVDTNELFDTLEYIGCDGYYRDVWYATIEELKKRVICTQEKGKWIFDQEENVLTQTGEFVATYHCSECGKKIKTVESYLSKNHCFCSVCGADMRGDV